VAKRARLALGQATAVLALVDRLADKRRPQVRFVRLADCVYRSDDGDPLVRSDLIGIQILVVQYVRRWHAPAGAMAARDGDVDLRRVDIAQLIELQRRLVGEDAGRPARPERRLHIRVETARRREREAVQAHPAALDLPSLGHAHEGHRVDAQLPRVVWHHEAVPLVGDLG
jgi:hypothetical protein